MGRLPIPPTPLQVAAAGRGARTRLPSRIRAWRRLLGASAAAGLLAFLACPVIAHAETAAAVIEHHRVNGYPSPIAALERLQAAQGRPGPRAPLGQRQQFDAALAEYASLAARKDVAAPALARLEAMAAQEGCGACRAQKLIIEAQAALVNAPADAESLIARAGPLIPADDQALKLQWLHVRGRLHDTQGQLGKAMADAVPALALADALGSTAARIDVMALMVGLNADLGHHARAERIADEAFALAEQHGYRYMMGFIRLHQGYLYALAEQPERQLASLQDALRITGADPGLAMVRVVTLANIADYHLQTREFTKALAHATHAELLARDLGDENARSVALANMGIAMARLGDMRGGIARLDEAIALARKLDAKTYEVAMYEELVSIHEDAGRPADALAALHRVLGLTRELTEQEREKAVLELQEKYDAERRGREIERLSSTNRLREAELAARTWQQRLWAAIAVVLALGAVPLVRRLVRARTANRKLQGDIAVLAEQSIHDPLTGAFNRRHCQALMGQHEAHLVGVDGRKPHAGVGLMILDVDFFKKVNDTHGHAAGDRVLVEIAQRLRALVRQQDAVVRWGGEEFVLVLPGTPADALESLAARVLSAVSEEPVEIGGGQRIATTVSIGSAVFPLAPGLRWEDSLHVADLALYLSKSGGRNRATCVAGVEPGAGMERLLRDLNAAHAAGDAKLATVVGHAPRFVAVTPTAA